MIAMPIVFLSTRTGTNREINPFEIWNHTLLKTNELRQFGEYLTQSLVLDAWIA